MLYKLPDSKLIANSEVVETENRILNKTIDYTIDYSLGMIIFKSDSLLTKTIRITYYILPDFLQEHFFLYKKQSIADSLLSQVRIDSPKSVWSTDKLIVKGSKTISLSFSNQQDYNLNQSLFLNLEGDLADNLKLEGRLSDSESPLTPEGNTKELSSLDQIYLKLYGKQYTVLLGDQDYSFENNALMKYKTKFEGLNLIYSDKFMLQGALAINNGKSQTVLIDGIDGKQGPYYIISGVTGGSMNVVPGSESVSLNGMYLSRGTDYTIDYQEGSLTFKKLITSNSRIVIEYQFSDDYYAQSTYLSSSAVNLNPDVRIRHHLIHQSDNRNNPLLWSFSDSDKDSLQMAGDREVWGQGIFKVEAGSGSYIQKVDSDNNIYYDYAPSDSTADYLVYFSYVGSGKGAYELFGNNKYRYVGNGMGSYLPAKKLIPPESRTNLGLNMNYDLGEFSATLEGVFTNHDRNTFSSLDDSDNSSFMALAKLEYKPISDDYIPGFSLQYLKRLKNSFTFSDYTSASEYYELPVVNSFDSLSQNIVDFYAKLSVPKLWESKISARFKNVESIFEQRYLNIDSRIFQTLYTPALKWYATFSRQAYNDSLQADSNVQYHSADISFRKGLVSLYSNLTYKLDDYTGHLPSAFNSINDNRLVRYSPGLSLGNDSGFGLNLSFSQETNSQRQNRDWLTSRVASTWQTSQFLNSGKNSLSLNYSHRDVDNSSLFSSGTETEDTRYDLMEFNSSHQLWDNSLAVNSSYSLNRLEFYPKIRELEYVGNGMGLYDSTGVLTENGDYDFYYITAKEGKLSTDINAGVNFFFHLSPRYLPASVIHRFRLDSNFQAANNTTDSNSLALYLLLPSDFFNSDSTLYGKKYMHHTLWIDLFKKVVTGKIRYENSDILDNRYQDFSRVSDQETELELDWKELSGYRIKTTYLHTLEKDSRYNSKIITNQAGLSLFRNFSASLNSQADLNFAREEGVSTVESDPYFISIIKFSPRFNWFLNRTYVLNGNLLLQNNNRSGSDYLSAFPEKRDGWIFNLTGQLQYRINSFTSGLLQYTGKSYPREEFQHELRMEFRAEL